jgi:hypothetical protein
MKIRADNFLEFLRIDSGAARKRRIFLFFRIIIYGFLVVFFVSLILLTFYFWAISDVYKLSKEGKVNLEAAAREIKTLKFEQADANLALAEKNFEEAKIRFSNLNFLLKIPWVKYQYGAVFNMLDAGISTAAALRDLDRVAGDLLSGDLKALMVLEKLPIDNEKSFFEINAKQKREILEKLGGVYPDLELAKQKIDLAFSSMEKIREDKVLGKILENMEPMREALLKLKDAIDVALPAAKILPSMAGYPREKTYLFLLQNNDELRPTGGFIGTYGIIRVKDGEIKLFKTDNVYALDGKAGHLNIKPPEPISKYLGINKWFFRDSNWSPSFPEAAERAKWFYYAEGGKEEGVDTVIAITPNFIEDILKQIGEVRLEEEIFSADNLMEILQYKVEKEYYEKGIPEENRKDIVGDLANEIFKKIGSLPRSHWPEMIKVMGKALEKKDILIWSNDLALENLILKQNWGGGIKETDNDYLMMVDANLGAYKTDGVTDKDISYSFSKNKDGKISAKVAIKYKNNGAFTWKTTRYRTYTRIFTPEGSVLIGGSGAMENDKILDPRRRPGKIDTGKEFGKTYFGAFISVEPKESKTLTFEYILPEYVAKKIEEGLYTLFVQKQPGAKINSLTLNLDFGKNIKYARPAEEKKKWGNDEYNLVTNLETDRSFEVGF